jgi:hypothetical protein
MKIEINELILGSMAFVFAILVLGGLITLVKLLASRICTMARQIEFLYQRKTKSQTK